MTTIGFSAITTLLFMPWQSYIGRKSLNMQLQLMGILSTDECISTDDNLYEKFRVCTDFSEYSLPSLLLETSLFSLFSLPFPLI